MKAQRRHDLQQNDLSKVITKAPTFWQQSGGKFLAVLVAVLVIVILIRYRISTNRQGQVQARDSLAQARTAINELQGTVQASFSPGAANEAAVQRRSAFNEGNAALSQAMTLSDDRKLQAEALIARGDLNWTAATLPELPGAATQPSLQLRDPKELFNTAAESYQTVLNSYSDDVYAVIAARFGLAAIAENRGDWDAAAKQYDELLKITKDFPSYQQMATQRRDRLQALKNPVVFGTPTTEPAAMTRPATMPLPPGIAAPTTRAATGNAMTQATAAPATRPTTQSAAPTTQALAPTTAPATQPK